VFVVLIWGQLRHVAHTDARPEPEGEDGADGEAAGPGAVGEDTGSGRIGA